VNLHVPALEGERVAIDRLTLRFSDADVEREYRRHHALASVPYVRASLALGVLFYGAFGVFGLALIPDAVVVAWVIRFAVVVPFILAMIVLVGRPSSLPAQQALLAMTGLVTGGGVVGMIVVAAPPGRDLYYAGLLVTSFYIFTLVRLRFGAALVSSYGVGLLYVAALLFRAPVPMVVVNNLAFLVALNAVGTVAVYSLDRSAREAFLQRRVIADQAASLGEALARVRVLRGLLPICAWCRRVRDDGGYWRQLEAYITAHSDTFVSHGICPDCAARMTQEVPDGGATSAGG
jgi:hypothetical protein